MEDALIVLIIFGSILAALKLAFDYARDKSKTRAAGGSSMTTSELKGVMREAVEEALDERLERLEIRLDKIEEPRMLSASRKPLEEMEVPPAPPVARDRDVTR